jgi:site-specific DNA-methyltransferase (adenine-specific)
VELPLNRILLGDCLELLKKLPDDSIDSVVTDPPYGLGNKDPDAMDIFMYVLGATLDTGGDFMGRDWDIPSVQIWREVYRVLKPGGYVVSFGGTRTFDLISIGLRMAGFECRDTISRFHPEVELPIIQWIQSQGMPKSRNPFKSEILPAIEAELRKQGVEGDIQWR